ncbi:hypothetical protein BpHYR1_014683 [Brachionus plicatilis]|uniref:Uncharacterized protein n=1 Tax=Brachionus plicatilis TaxID=10195 RepID=A0A3M7RHI5_BRAPC|nr:hypothetical protein BpHYR1_014683 [Brachionus plicatilis]
MQIVLSYLGPKERKGDQMQQIQKVERKNISWQSMTSRTSRSLNLFSAGYLQFSRSVANIDFCIRLWLGFDAGLSASCLF